MLLSSGTHGSEPAAVYALLKFLQKPIYKWLDKCSFLVFPCINPYGFYKNQRKNQQGHDINRSFGGKTPLTEESRIIMRWLEAKNRRYEFTIDMHEDSIRDIEEGYFCSDYPGRFYLYENCPDKKKRIGKALLSELKKKGVKISHKKDIWGDANSKGVIWYPEGRKSRIYNKIVTFDDYLMKNFTGQSLVIETPASLRLKKRISLHLDVLDTALGLKLP